MVEPSAAGGPLILPVGTRIVSRIARAASAHVPGFDAGAVGEIVESPMDAEHRYRVRFVDGVEARLLRRELSILKAHKEHEHAPASAPIDEHGLARFVIFRCVVGSRAYGLDTEASDWDRRGVYLPPAERHWSLAGVPEQLEDEDTQECYWELQKFLELALKSNPNVLECLWSPLVESATPLGRELLALRSALLSQLVFQTYSGYVASQFRKIEADLRQHGAPKWKHVMHLLRLLTAGVGVLATGEVPVDVGDQRPRLLAVRRGQLAWEEVQAWRQELHVRFTAAALATRLPVRPDYERVDAFLRRARRLALQDTLP